jgi:hypothetical protein
MLTPRFLGIFELPCSRFFQNRFGQNLQIEPNLVKFKFVFMYDIIRHLNTLKSKIIIVHNTQINSYLLFFFVANLSEI